MTIASAEPAKGRPFQRRPDPDAATLADLRRRYDGGEITASGIAAAIGLSADTTRKRLIEWGWLSPRPRKGKPKRKTVKVGALARGGQRLLKRVESEATRLLGVLEIDLASPTAEEDIERRARTLASLVKTLGELGRIQGGSGSSHGRDAAADPSAAGADLARIKSDLVARLVATHSEGGDSAMGGDA